MAGPRSSMRDFELFYGIDWGTSKCAIAYVLTCKGEYVHSPKSVLMYGRGYEVPMKATWEDGKFIHGFALQDHADTRPEIGDKIVVGMKLPLYTDKRTSTKTAKIESILKDLPGNKTLDMLISEHLKAVVAEAKKCVLKSQELWKFSMEEKNELLERARIRVTVPQMWSLDARRRMQLAAKNAGLRLVTLASEPACALAYLIEKIAQNRIPLDRQVGEGDKIMVCDIGAGTADVCYYKLKDSISTKSRLSPIGKASGQLCGSSKVDELLWETLVQREGEQWVKDCAQKLEISERDFERRALGAIEEAKTSLCQRQFYVKSVQGKGRSHVALELSRQEIEHAMDNVIAGITKLIDEVAMDDGEWPNLLEVTGGFANSKYLFQKLCERYEKHGSRVLRPNDGDNGQGLPVCMGSLLRYNNIEPQPFPQVALAMLQLQVFDQKKPGHADSFIIPNRRRPNKIEEKPWVKQSPWDAEVDVVEDRMVPIKSKEKTLVLGEVHEPQFPEEFRIPVSDPRLTVELVYSTKNIKKDSAAKILIGGADEEKYEFQDGVHPWASLDQPIPKEKLEDKGFETFTNNGKKYWLLHVKVIVRWVGEDMRIGFKIMKPLRQQTGKRKRDASGEDPYQQEVAFELWESIWDSRHSEFME